MPRLGVLLLLLPVLGLSACGDSGEQKQKQKPVAQAEDLAPLKSHPQVVEPKAGGAQAPAPKPSASSASASAQATEPKPSVSSANPLIKARALPAGVAIPPLEAPVAVRQIIDAGNQIARTPYLWGGGHGKWVDKGYDCSGSVSYALASAGLLSAPQDSGRLMSWGAPGRGKWITVFSSRGHVFLEVAGIRFDTSGARVTGSRWQDQGRSTSGFVARHWPGL